MKKKRKNTFVKWIENNKLLTTAIGVTTLSLFGYYNKSIKIAELQNENDNLKTLIEGQTQTILNQQFSIGKLSERLKNKK